MSRNVSRYMAQEFCLSPGTRYGPFSQRDRRVSDGLAVDHANSRGSSFSRMRSGTLDPNAMVFFSKLVVSLSPKHFDNLK